MQWEQAFSPDGALLHRVLDAASRLIADRRRTAYTPRSMITSSAWQSRRRAGLIAVLAISAAVFWRTAFPTITWWDSSRYSLAAGTLGLTGPPGSLLLTLLGWPLTKLPLGLSPGYLLNLVAGLLGALTVALVFSVALRLPTVREARGTPAVSRATVFGVALGALTFAFSATLWEHAVMFTPYVLTAVFTALILGTMLTWWTSADRPDSWRWLLLLGFLFGLDFSVHRTNSLLIPGALVWVLLRRPGALREARSWLSAVGGLSAGLAVHLLIIPISRGTRSPLNMFEPNTLSRLWDYVALEGMGGNFLINLWPRQSDFWTSQVADLLRVLGDNFVHWRSPVGILGALPLVAGLIGLGALWRRQRRLAAAFALALLLQATITVLYFNIPTGYFRSLDRHYLPICVTFAVLVAYGLGVIAQSISAVATIRGRALAMAGTALLLVVPAAQLAGNYDAQDASDRHFTSDYAVNALKALPPNAIYFTAGDNDTFPVLYAQAVEGVRRDVSIIHVGLTNVAWYVDQILRAEPSFPLSMTQEARDRMLSTTWTDTLRVDSVTLHPKPANEAGALPEDVVRLDIVRTNDWKRPLTFAITVGSEGLGWLRPLARLEGLHWRIVPANGVRTDPGILRANLLSAYEYRGYADSATVIDDTSRTIGLQYYNVFVELLEAERTRGNAGGCRDVHAKLIASLPPDRLALPAELRERLASACGS